MPAPRERGWAEPACRDHGGITAHTRLPRAAVQALPVLAAGGEQGARVERRRLGLGALIVFVN